MHIIKLKEHLHQISKKKKTYSECLDQMIRLNLSIKAIRSMDTAGGFDKYILSISNNKLSSKALKIKKAIKNKINIKNNKTKKKSLKKN